MLILVAGTGGSCTTHRPPPTAGFATNRDYHGSQFGFVSRIAYFTAAEESDPRWEERRLAEVRPFRQCSTGYRMLRRDIRWYPATIHSGRRCAAIVYTIQCNSHDPARADALEQDRLFLLRMDAESPPGRNCGNKFPPEGYYREPPTEEALFERLVSTNARCAGPDRLPHVPIHLFDETRINVDVRVHPALVRTPAYVFSVRYTGLAGGAISSSFSGAGLIPPRLRQPDWPGPRIRPPRIANDGRNILVTLDYAPGPSGRPYCVQLTARQGSQIWRRRIERPGFVEHMRAVVGVDRFGQSNDPARYWDPLIDARALSRTFGDYLVAHADPVYAQGRPRSTP